MPSISAIKTSDNINIFNPNNANRSFKIDKANYGNIWRNAKGKFYALYNTLKSGIQKLRGIACCTVAIPNGLTINETYIPLLSRLKYQADLSDHAGLDYCKILEERHPTAQLIDSYLIVERPGAPVLPERGNGKKQLMIPIVLKEFPKNHIVSVFVSFDEQDNATIEYYDSKGLKIGDRGAGARLACCPDLTLGKVIASIADKYCPNKFREGRDVLPAIVQNNNKDQFDCHNCGVYVCNYFEQRLTRHHPSIIFRTCNSFERTITMRERMIRNVLQVAIIPQSPTKVTERVSQKKIEEVDEGFVLT